MTYSIAVLSHIMSTMRNKTTSMKTIDELQQHIFALENMTVSEWYRGVAHSLHLEFGKLHKIKMHGHLGDVQGQEGDYSLFLHGAWTINSGDNEIDSIGNDISEIDLFIRDNSLDKCIKIEFNYKAKKLFLYFSDGSNINVKQEDDSWFVLTKHNEFSFSLKDGGTIEYSEK